MADISSLNWTFSSLGCPEASLEEICELARRFDMAGVEIRAVEGEMDPPAVFRKRYRTPDAVQAVLDRFQLRIHSLDTSWFLMDRDPAARGHFLEFLPWAEALGVKWLRVFDGGKPVDSLSQEDLDWMVSAISWWRGQRSENGWSADIMIETHDCLCRHPAIRQLQAALDPAPAILWDSHHTWKRGGEDPLETWKLLHPSIPHIHVKDSISVASANHAWTYVHGGEGEFPLEALLSTLAEEGVELPVSLEWERAWHPYLDPLRRALESLRERGWL